eukprot:2208542-Pyramimonas_sp.AAC.1
MTRLMGVGVAIVCTEAILPELRITGAVFGPLQGDRQVVPRGELMALYLAIWTTARYLTYTTDCEAAAQGWYKKRFEQPTGLDADPWQKIGDLMQARFFCDVVVLWTNAHLGPAEIVDGKGARTL